MPDNNKKEFYRKQIIEKVRKMENLEFLEMMYGFAKRLCKEEAD